MDVDRTRAERRGAVLTCLCMKASDNGTSDPECNKGKSDNWAMSACGESLDVLFRMGVVREPPGKAGR